MIKFDTEMTGLFETFDKVKFAVDVIVNLDDDEAGELSDRYYSYLDESASIISESYDLNFEEVRSYLKVKVHLEMYDSIKNGGNE